jgi:hypothetical protein
MGATVALHLVIANPSTEMGKRLADDSLSQQR